MEIHADFWPGQRLCKKLFGRRRLYVSFSTARLHPESWINRLSVSREVPCDDLCGESEGFTEEFDDVLLVLNVEILWVALRSVVIATKVIYCVIYRKRWQTNLRYVRLSSCSNSRILCAKHQNASWVFSLGDFVLAYSVLKDCAFLICFRPTLRYGRHGLTD